MKNLFKLMLLCATVAFIFPSCSKDDFDYPMDALIGTWSATEVESDGRWVDVTVYPYTKLGFSATFYEDGTYYGRGFFGTGKGTYKATGKTVVTYVDGEEYLSYKITSLNGKNAQVIMSQCGSSSTLNVKLRKE